VPLKSFFARLQNKLPVYGKPFIFFLFSKLFYNTNIIIIGFSTISTLAPAEHRDEFIQGAVVLKD